MAGVKEAHLNSDRSEIYSSEQFSNDLPAAERFQAIVDNMAEALIEINSSWLVTSVNNQVAALLGIQRERLLGKILWDAFAVDATSDLFQYSQQAINQKFPVEFDEFYPPLNRWLSVRLVPIPHGLLAYFLDITERKQLETKLRKEQDFLNVLLDNIQAGIVACDANGQLKLFNQAARLFHGLPVQPILPEQWAEYYNLYLPDGKTPMNTADIPLFRALQGERVENVEMTIAPQQGVARIFSANGQAIANLQGEKQGAVVVMHDITERKQIENALRESEARLSSIFQTMPDGIVIINPDGQIIAANRAAEQILKLTNSSITERVYNDPSWSITTVEGQPFPEAELPFARVMQTGEAVYGVEHAIAHADSTTSILSINASPLFNAAGEIISVITAVTDITERQKVEAALQESQERYRSVIEAAAEGIVLQYADGAIFTCNPSAEKILGLTADQIMGRTSLDPRWRAVYEDGSPFPGELHPSMVTLRTGEPQTNVIMGIHKPDASLTWISINTRPLFSVNSNQPYAVVASFFDITEQQAALRDRQQAEEKRVQLVREQVARAAAEAAQQQSAFLAEVSAVLASSLDYQQTLQSVADLAVPYFADWCSVDLLNEDNSISRVAIAHIDPQKQQFGWELAQRYPRKLDDCYGISQVMQTGNSEIVTQITDEQLTAAIADAEYLELLRGLGLKSCIIAPLKAQEKVFGSISFVFTESKRHYSQKDLTLAEDLARRAAIAIDNARLYQQAQQARQAAETAADRTARLQTVTAALSQSLTPLQVVEVIVEQSMAVLKATSAMVVLVSDDGTELELVKAVGYESDLSASWQRFSMNTPVPLTEAIRTGEPVWMETVGERVSRYPHLAENYSKYDNSAWMSLPLVAEGRSVGGMSLNFLEYKQLTADDREFILAISRQCAQAISRAQLYEAERQARAEAEQANRVKDEFLAVLSHELRSPLNPILGWTKLLQTQKLTPTKAQQALETIERNAKLQAQLIEDLLDISRMLRGKLSLQTAPVNLIEVIAGAIETVQLAANSKSIQIQTILQPGKQTVFGDANRLQQVFWNLLSNAIKFTPEGGRVEVKLAEIGKQVQIQVIDNGKGINADFIPHVFEYFRQADSSTTRRFGGLGLGLAIVRQIVELHGGTVEAQSQGEGLGATFTVLLPATSIEPESSPDNQPSRLSVNLTGLRILVVDDEADMGNLAEFILTQHGADVTVATSAAEVLNILPQFLPDLLLCDIGMPEMDGNMLIQQLRKLSPAQGGTIPAIALTAYATECDRNQALAAGFQLHLPKPVEPEVLLEAVVRVIQTGV
ncbi:MULTISPECIES: hybrid sensor histidine kinase/response regulator [unclassified Calothrix]|uniref:hybrid sensor histidine kinase/response regulator n=1 Tax=unclassified Calothrix TaxID=2619626 RepID=UPI0028C4B835|nr:PAS domain S-box protein [Calothrix sp. FACHB-168]